MSFAVVLVVLVTCFFAPSWMEDRQDRDWLGVKRMLLGIAAVWIALSATLILFHLFGAAVVLRLDFLFLFLSSSVYWIPFLLIRVIQLGLRDRKFAQGSVA
ncbi:hypothetical protein [Parasedimentitalea maritima]|uniref:Uncharacterized protein n=1 Tax=Parasedimentitalea maritima TaxID=2578117 RepID=A0A6A4RG24_9RHOB|nr:hypothetical protein [Zongyanglinia marina]KAE9632403.1 hypothetical protein GP644_01095 [Zongyanglinia marina]